MPVFDIFKSQSKSALKDKAKSAYEKMVEGRENPKTRSVRIH